MPAAEAPAVVPPIPGAPPPPAAAVPAPPVAPAPQADANDLFAFLSGQAAAGPSPPAAGPQGPGARSAGAATGRAASKPGRGQICNVPVSFEPIMSHAMRVWQRNLGLLFGTNLLAGVAAWAVSIPFNLLQYVLVKDGEHQAGLIAAVAGLVAMVITQIYLGIGQAQISLKLARGGRAEISDLFGGGKLLFPVLGAGLLAGLAYGLAGGLCFVLGILLLLGYWPFYFLIVDEKSSAMGSFTRAAKIAERNWGTAFVILLVSFCIILIGVAALCIGTIVAVPLVSLLWATAYLMMSGQLPVPAAGEP